MPDTLLDSAEAAHNPAALANQLVHERAADIVELLNEQTPEVAASVLQHLPPERAIEVLDQSGLDHGPEIVSALPRDTALALLTGVSADRLADLFRQLGEPHRTELLDRLDPDTKSTIQHLLAYPPDTAGAIMTTEFVSVPATYTVQQTLDHIRKVERTRETVYAIYVLDPHTQKLAQVVTLRRLITGEPSAPVLSVALPRRPVTVGSLTDREDVGEIDDGVLASALEDASAEMDTYLASRYSVPVKTHARFLAGLCCDIARYRLSGSETAETNPIRIRYRDAIRFLVEQHHWMTNEQFSASVGAVWHAPDSQIYPELRRMEGDGLVEATELPSGGRRTKREYRGIARAGWIGDYMDPFTFLDIFSTRGGNNGTGWFEPEYVEMLRRANAEPDPAKRYQLLANAEAYMLDAQPVIPLYTGSTSWLKKPYVMGMYANPITIHPWKYVYIEHDPSKWE